MKYLWSLINASPTIWHTTLLTQQRSLHNKLKYLPKLCLQILNQGEMQSIKSCWHIAIVIPQGYWAHWLYAPTISVFTWIFLFEETNCTFKSNCVYSKLNVFQNNNTLNQSIKQNNKMVIKPIFKCGYCFKQFTNNQME